MDELWADLGGPDQPSYPRSKRGKRVMKFRRSTMPLIATPIILMAATFLFTLGVAGPASASSIAAPRGTIIMPMPARWALLVTGFGALGATQRKRRLDTNI